MNHETENQDASEYITISRELLETTARTTTTWIASAQTRFLYLALANSNANGHAPVPAVPVLTNYRNQTDNQTLNLIDNCQTLGWLTEQSSPDCLIFTDAILPERTNDKCPRCTLATGSFDDLSREELIKLLQDTKEAK